MKIIAEAQEFYEDESPSNANNLLAEDGSALLTESGSNILTEP